MQTLLYSFLLFVSNYRVVEAAPTKDVPIYDVPKTAEHPFGDEHFSNMNMLDNDTQLLHCNERKESELAKLNGKCPLNEEDSRLMDPYITCPGYIQIPPPNELIYSSGETPGPQVQCRKCDLHLTPDNKAVIVECFQCFDIPTPKHPAN